MSLDSSSEISRSFAKLSAVLRTGLMPWVLATAGCATSTPSTAPAPTFALRFQDAALACDDDGNVYVAATEIFQEAKQILVAASNRYGETWNRRVAYVSSSLDGDRGRPQLVTGAAGEVYVLWEDTRHGRVDVFFNRSLDGGRSWLGSDVLVSGGTQQAVRLAAPALCADDRGNLYVLWRDEREGFQAFFVNHSGDRGSTWLDEPLRFTSLSTSFKSAPVAACDDEGRLHVAWLEVENDAVTLHVNSSNDHGANWKWDSEILAHPPLSNPLFPPTLAVGARGAVFLGWWEVRAGLPVVLMDRSLDYGNSWEARPRILSSRGAPLRLDSPPRLLCDRYGQLYAVWQGMATNGSSLFVVQSSGDDGRSFVESRVPRTGLWQLGPDFLRPENRLEPFRSSVDDSGNLYLTWTEGESGIRAVGFDRVSNHGADWLALPHSVGTSTHLPRTLEAPLLCNDNSGHVFLLWNEGHTLTVASSPFYGDSGWRYEHF